MLLSEWGGKIEKKEISFHGIFKWGVEQKYMEFLFFSPQKNAKNFTLFSLRVGGGARERLIARVCQNMTVKKVEQQKLNQLFIDYVKKSQTFCFYFSFG